MSAIYDNWARLVDAVVDREHYRQLCRDNSSEYSSYRSSSVDFSVSSPFHDHLLSPEFSGAGAGASSSDWQDHSQASIPEPVGSISGPGFKKLVFAVDVRGEKEKIKAMKAVSKFAGTESISFDQRNKKLTVIGDIDPMAVLKKLRKSLNTELLSVGPKS